MKDIDSFIDMVCGDLTPEMVAEKSHQYHKEFDAYMGELPSDANEELAFRSFISHKVAAMDAALARVIEFLENVEFDVD
jgi:hypothetical protein